MSTILYEQRDHIDMKAARMGSEIPEQLQSASNKIFLKNPPGSCAVVDEVVRGLELQPSLHPLVKLCGCVTRSGSQEG